MSTQHHLPVIPVKRGLCITFVIPAKAGIQSFHRKLADALMDSGLRRNDGYAKASETKKLKWRFYLGPPLSETDSFLIRSEETNPTLRHPRPQLGTLPLAPHQQNAICELHFAHWN